VKKIWVVIKNVLRKRGPITEMKPYDCIKHVYELLSTWCRGSLTSLCETLLLCQYVKELDTDYTVIKAIL
jgi:hypothetical protein